MIMQGYATDALQAVHLENSQRADVLLHHSSCFYSKPDMTMHCKKLHFNRQSPRGPDVGPSEFAGRLCLQQLPDV